LSVFGLVDILPSDPINYLFSIFSLTTTPDMTIVILSVAFGIVAFIVNAVLSGAAIKFALDDYGGQTANVGMSFSHAFGKITRIVTVQLIMTLIFSAITAPSLNLMMRGLEGIDIYTYPPTIDPEAMQLLTMGAMLLMVGGIFILFITVKFAPALAIVVDTDLSAIDSLKKAWAITSGNFLHVLGGQILIGFAVGLLGMIITVPLGVFMFLNPWALVAGTIFVALLFSAPSLIYIAVLYRDLMARAGPLGSDLPEYVL
jgi:membrane-anchored glycerophosphoryl diester phosphodiesterase (GDPDase)